MLYHNTYSESSLSRRVLMVSAHVASSVCMRCEIVWYVFEFSLSSITPCNSKSEYSFWKIFGNRTTVFKLVSNYVQFSKYQALITVMGTLNNTVMTHLVLKCSKLLNTNHVSFGVSQQKGNVLHTFTHNTVKLFSFSSVTSTQKLLYTAVLWQVQSWGFRSPGMWHCASGFWHSFATMGTTHLTTQHHILRDLNHWLGERLPPCVTLRVMIIMGASLQALSVHKGLYYWNNLKCQLDATR